jgi:hypothetical protein
MADDRVEKGRVEHANILQQDFRSMQRACRGPRSLRTDRRDEVFQTNAKKQARVEYLYGLRNLAHVLPSPLTAAEKDSLFAAE